MATRTAAFYTNPLPCKHLEDYKLKHGLNGYRSLQKFLRATLNGRTSVKMSEYLIARCISCNGSQGRIFLCLVCSSFSCSTHILLHARSKISHDIAVDIERSELYCCMCNDQVYDPDFDRVVVSKIIMDMPSKTLTLEDNTRRSSKRRKLNSAVDLDLKKIEQLALSKDGRAKSCYPPGLRGLNNLGNTCFMNSVLQALVHAPPFKNYFLSDRHDRETCGKRSSDRLCLTCNMDAIVLSMFSGDRTPYNPAQFLYSCWRHSTNLASYEQQDAHEFFISVLDAIHENDRNEGSSNEENSGLEGRKAFIDWVFSGMLRSDLICMTCGFTSSTYDPFLDMSLDLNTTPVNLADRSITSKESTRRSTLLGCLDLFTMPEKLGSDEKLYCENCKEKRASLKQMSVRRLPLVLSLHIKRFEHSAVRKLSRKIDWHLPFPFTLDMTPYLSSSIISSRIGNRMFSFDSDEKDTAEFEIFAVITHSGRLESGHYVTYLRLRNQWYKCDDAWITEVDEEIVRASECYMLFYAR
ncbi:hypothetical protein K2173_025855 [Erythroxylum novogranatense]|uniref:ubiquitinyl hydrolase 1 n=1 Tax=Erythroxylum novogranatense TaxID=1862640 RepID=A0AAV8SHF5_9ROSI|nr:hypothetical protein K2173_025855 [Erythroxylum novogranatense]